MNGLFFGWRTAVLLVAASVLLPIAAALWQSLANRKAAQALSLLLVVLVGVFTPWMIGFAGFYDRWRWLTFLPVAVPLWVPALMYFYVYALVHGRWPAGALRLLLPGAVEFVFQFGSFLLPLSPKLKWAKVVAPIAGPLFAIALILAFVFQARESLKLLRLHRAALADARSDGERYALRWLTRSLRAFTLLWTLWAAALIWDAIAPLGYEGFMALYLLIAGFALYLGIEGWRQAVLPFPTIESLVPAIAQPAAAVYTKDWQVQAAEWAARVKAEGWAGEPTLTLASVARRLGTNTAYLSRALNEGLEVNFSTLVNRIRSESVAEAIRSGATADLLTLALEAGFSSKASFNRAFSATYGMPPSAYRAQVSNLKKPTVSAN